MALGETLRNARLSRKLTVAQVSAATQMTIPMVEALEQEDFSRIAAPIYGKGFIRLYATCVGLDPRPLIDEYMSRFAAVKAPPLVAEIDLARKDKFSAGIGLGTTVVDKDDVATDFAPAEESNGEHAEEVKTGKQTESASASEPLLPRLGAITEKIAKGGAQLLEKSVEAMEKKDSDAGATWRERRSNLRDDGFAKLALKYLPIGLAILIVLIFVMSSLSRCARKTPSQASVSTQQGPEKLRIAVAPPEPYVE